MEALKVGVYSFTTPRVTVDTLASGDPLTLACDRVDVIAAPAALGPVGLITGHVTVYVVDGTMVDKGREKDPPPREVTVDPVQSRKDEYCPAASPSTKEALEI
jgi:hypothetical protein